MASRLVTFAAAIATWGWLADPAAAQSGPAAVPTAEYVLESGNMMCTTLSGFEKAQLTMNKAQLESLGCLVTAREVGVERNTSRFGYLPFGPEQVSVMFPDKVISVWVRGSYLVKNPHIPDARYRSQDDGDKERCAAFRARGSKENNISDSNLAVTCKRLGL